MAETCYVNVYTYFVQFGSHCCLFFFLSAMCPLGHWMAQSILRCRTCFQVLKVVWLVPLLMRDLNSLPSFLPLQTPNQRPYEAAVANPVFLFSFLFESTQPVGEGSHFCCNIFSCVSVKKVSLTVIYLIFFFIQVKSPREPFDCCFAFPDANTMMVIVNKILPVVIAHGLT